MPASFGRSLFAICSAVDLRSRLDFRFTNRRPFEDPPPKLLFRRTTQRMSLYQDRLAGLRATRCVRAEFNGNPVP